MVRQKAFYHHAEGRMTQLTTTPSSRTDAELLAAVRDAIYRVTTGHQSFTIDGVVYTLANLDQLRRMEAALSTRVAQTSSGAGYGGIRSTQVVF